jgi:hypothetical protein
MHFDWKGQNPNNISNKTTPNDQISALDAYVYPLRT